MKKRIENLLKKRQINQNKWNAKKSNEIKAAIIGAGVIIFATLFNGYLTILDSDTIIDSELESVNVQNLRLSEDSLGNYLVELTIENPNTENILMKNLHMHYSQDIDMECSAPIERILRLEDTITLNGYNTENKSIWSGSITESTTNYQTSAIGAFYQNCGITEFYMKLDTSFELPKNKYSKLFIQIPKSIKITKNNSLINGERYKTIEPDGNENYINWVDTISTVDLKMTEYNNYRTGNGTWHIVTFAEFDKIENISFSKNLLGKEPVFTPR